MKLKELKNMPLLKATPTMLRLAADDNPNKSVKSYEYYKKFKH